MNEIILDSGTGWFSLNNDIYPVGHYRIVAQGENIIVLNTDNKLSFQAHSSQFVDSEGVEIGDATDILNSLKEVAFKVGGGSGDGTTNVVLTQEEYDNIEPDPNTTYDIIE